jgi:hypothetical protein
MKGLTDGEQHSNSPGFGVCLASGILDPGHTIFRKPHRFQLQCEGGDIDSVGLETAALNYWTVHIKVKDKVISQSAIIRPVSPGIRPPSGTRGKFFFLSTEIFFRYMQFCNMLRLL